MEIQEPPHKSFFQEYKEAILAGQEGRNRFIPVPFPRLSQHLGVGRNLYTLIGGNPGTGKSAFAHLAYILGPYNVWKKMRDEGETDVKLKIILFSMERSRQYTLAKWACMILLRRYG